MLLRGKRILIVEDNTLNRVVYQIALGAEGAHLDFDRWGREAIDRLRRFNHWDLLVLDLMLHGGISGFDIFRQIRAMPEYDHLPIVAISASEPAIAMPHARELGFSGYISKPIDESRLASQLAQVIAGEQVWYDGILIGS